MDEDLSKEKKKILQMYEDKKKTFKKELTIEVKSLTD